MFTVRENDIVNSTVVITRRMIGEFRRADGWIGIVRYERFERPPHRETNTPNSAYKKKGNTLLSKASPLKLPQSFCMIATYATPSRRDVQHRESLFLAEQARWMGGPIVIGGLGKCWLSRGSGLGFGGVGDRGLGHLAYVKVSPLHPPMRTHGTTPPIKIGDALH